MRERVTFAVMVGLAVLLLTILGTSFAHAQPGFGVGLMTPLKDGPGWTAFALQLSWSMKLTKAPSFGVSGYGFAIPEAGNGQGGIGLDVNLGEASRAAKIKWSDEFQAVLDASNLGPAIATDKLDFKDWSHWSAGFAFRYVVPVAF